MTQSAAVPVHPVDERLPLPKLFTLGLQHVLVMYAGAVAVPLIIGGALKMSVDQIAFLINADLFACGIATLIQTLGLWIFGLRLPIMMGVIAAFGVDKRSNIAAGIMIIVAQATSIWNVGIQTAAAQNLLTVGFMDKMLGDRITWAEWLVAGAPWAIIMSIVLVVLVLKLMPPEADAIAGGKEAVEAQLREMGPMTSAQKRLLAVSIGLLLFWATEGKLHRFDTTSVTYVGLVVLMLPLQQLIRETADLVIVQ